MKRFIWILSVSVLFQAIAAVTVVAENGSKELKQGAYIVKVGHVRQVFTRSLVLDDKQYPISVFVRVFNDSENGVEIPMHTIVSIGKIDKARIYLLGGKVEKIIILKNI